MANRSKTCFFKSSSKPNSQVQLLRLIRCRLLANKHTSMMQRALISRSALLAQVAAATLDGPLAARSAPLLQRLDRSMSSVTIPPPACMLRPLEAPLRYLFGPGPSNVPPRILAAGSRPIIGHLHSEMYEVTLCFKVGMSKKLISCINFFWSTVFISYIYSTYIVFLIRLLRASLRHE